jgi:hypothetical protein
VLFNARDRALVADGSITVAFRRWRRPTVKAGGQLTTADGVLSIDEVMVIDEAAVTDADARAAGRADAATLLSERGLQRDGELYRVRFHRAGDDPRIELRSRAALSDDEITELVARLDRFDRTSRHGAWTRATLRLIAGQPEVRAADLARQMPEPLETQVFKTDVRKLKQLGLTESLEVGYRLSPRGTSLWAALDG